MGIEDWIFESENSNFGMYMYTIFCNELYAVKPVLRDHSMDQRVRSHKTGGLLVQVNYSEKCAWEV